MTSQNSVKADLIQRIPSPEERSNAFYIWRYSHPSEFVLVRYLFDSAFYPDTWLDVEQPFMIGITDHARISPQMFPRLFCEWFLFDYMDRNGYSLAERMAFDDPSLRDWSLYQRYSRFQVTSADRNHGTIQATDVFSGKEFTIHSNFLANMPNVLVGTHGMRITKVGNEWHVDGSSFHDLDMNVHNQRVSFIEDALVILGCFDIKRVVTTDDNTDE